MQTRTTTEYRMSHTEVERPRRARLRSFRIVPEGAPIVDVTDSDAANDHLVERVNLPRGWYETPNNPAQQRYWDGHQFVASRPTPPEELERALAATEPPELPARRPAAALQVVATVVMALSAALLLVAVVGTLPAWLTVTSVAAAAISVAVLGYCAQRR